MPSFNDNLLPATTGLDLGASNQRWDAFLQTGNFAALVSSSTTPATSGTVQLASGDTIAWRDALNLVDLFLGIDSSKRLIFTGGLGIGGPFVSEQINPAATGELRLAGGDSINFRNAAGTADIQGLSKDASDRAVVGDVNGASSAAYSSKATLPATAGQVRLGNTETINWRDAANTTDQGLSLDASNRIVNSAAAGLLLSGATPSILLGGATASFPSIRRAATALNFRLADNSNDAPIICAAITATGPFTAVGGVGTIGAMGVPGVVGKYDATGQTAASTNQNVVATTPAAGRYRLSGSLKITVAAATSSTLGPISVIYTSADNVAMNVTAACSIVAGTIATSSAGNTVTTALYMMPMLLDCKVGTAIQVGVGYASNVAATMTYDAHFVAEYLG